MTDLIAVLSRNAAQVRDPALRLRLETAIAALRARADRRGEPQRKRGESGKRRRWRRRSEVDRVSQRVMNRYGE